MAWIRPLPAARHSGSKKSIPNAIKIRQFEVALCPLDSQKRCYRGGSKTESDRIVSQRCMAQGSGTSDGRRRCLAAWRLAGHSAPTHALDGYLNVAGKRIFAGRQVALSPATALILGGFTYDR